MELQKSPWDRDKKYGPIKQWCEQHKKATGWCWTIFTLWQCGPNSWSWSWMKFCPLRMKNSGVSWVQSPRHSPRCSWYPSRSSRTQLKYLMKRLRTWNLTWCVPTNSLVKNALNYAQRRQSTKLSCSGYALSTHLSSHVRNLDPKGGLECNLSMMEIWLSAETYWQTNSTAMKRYHGKTCVNCSEKSCKVDTLQTRGTEELTMHT